MAIRKTPAKASRAAAASTSRRKTASPKRAARPKPAPAPVKPAAPAASPAKSIILFSDGTGNHSGKLFKTNVWRLYEALDLGPPAGDRQRQIAYYDNGVGTSGFKPLAMLGGILGLGLKRNVLEIYRYACRNYDPDSRPAEGSGITDQGDQIYGFGFSRGAFTMRLVIGLIADQGLIRYTDEADLHSKTSDAWRAFRRTSRRRAFRWLRNLFGRAAPESIDEAAAQEKSLGAAAQRERESDKNPSSENHRPVIRMIGVWDTVAAYGGPFAEITRAIDNWIYPLSMPNYALHPRIRCARHALSLDDERDSFWPLLWDEVAEAHIQGKPVDGKPAPWLDKDRLKQVWFAGMHADVGGGYPDESLSYVSLLWMIGEAQRSGLRTADEITARYVALANSFGPIHDSRGGMGSYYRYQPRKLAAFIAAPRQDPIVTTTLSLRDPLVGDGRAEKGLLTKVVVHESVVARIATGTDGYAPIVLPAAYEVVPPRPSVSETSALATSGGNKAEDAQPDKATPLLPDHVRDWLTPASTAATAQAMEGPWNYVLGRRMTYFATVILMILLVTMPWWVGGNFRQDANDLQLALDGRGLIGNLIRLPGGLLPGFLQPWVEAWANNSVTFFSLIWGILILGFVRTRLRRKLRNKARAIWRGAVPRIPPATATASPVALAAHVPSWVERWRTSRFYQRWVQFVKWGLLPNFVFAPLLAALLAIGLLGVTTQAALPWVERSQSMCPAGPVRNLDAGTRFDFRTDSLCQPSGIWVKKGERYLISIEVDEPWRDAGYPTDVRGLSAGDIRWTFGYWGVPLRRVLDARYLQPLAAVRVRGDGERFFSRLFGSMPVRPLTLMPAEGQPNRSSVEFEAPADGELLMFVNDAVLLFDPARFYRNNEGTACVTVTPARPASGEIGQGGAICRRLAAKPAPAGPPD